MGRFMDKGYQGMVLLLQEQVTTFNAAKAPFANAPNETQFAIFTVRSQGICISFDAAVNPTVGGLGFDYAANDGSDPYVFQMAAEELRKIKAIEKAASATIEVAYFKWR